MPAYKMEKIWRNDWPWHSYAEIYLGHVSDLTFSDEGAGIADPFHAGKSLRLSYHGMPLSFSLTNNPLKLNIPRPNGCCGSSTSVWLRHRPGA